MTIDDLQGIEYDSCGRIKYHPELHFKQKSPWTEEDLEYLCKFNEFDHLETVALALGRTKATVCTKLYELRKKDLIKHYKNLNKYW
ncbi:hypothetical protein [Bacillus massiliigorillae]|uniref:hypothetical protein n=1 Tax=Bacillus massiliigorillae TaxID=1243664 RepID=UPI00039B9097|nr:hypothetical protein [Bacillus massiliigorillae]